MQYKSDFRHEMEANFETLLDSSFIHLFSMIINGTLQTSNKSIFQIFVQGWSNVKRTYCRSMSVFT